MDAKATCAVPQAKRVDEALGDSAVLQSLRARLQASNGRLAVVQRHLPGHLAAHVKAGPLDDEAWSLIAANAAVAAKLRQVAPTLIQALADAGWPARQFRIKVGTAERPR